MRFFEIAQPERQVVATKRFIKDYSFYAKGYPQEVPSNLKAFLEFRKTNLPTQPWSSKDSPLSPPMRGIWHVHFVHGKCILIYNVAGDQIRLMALVEHNDIEGGSKTHYALAKYCNDLTANDFTPWTQPTPGKYKVAVGSEWDLDAIVELTDDEFEAIKGTIYDFAAHPSDRSYIEGMASGTISQDLWEVLFSTISQKMSPEDAKKAIAAKFGSPEAMKSFAIKVLRDTAQH